MTHIHDFPIELFDRIFNILCRSCKDDGYPSKTDELALREAGFPVFARYAGPLYTMPWNDADERSETKYPFNAANVCTLWRDVLFNSPVNWTDLAFDLAQDPRPLMGAFAASSPLLFSVLIFTTASDAIDEGKAREHERARIIVQHLQQYIQRCNSIIFDLTFASSLPSPVTFLLSNPSNLWRLLLDYQVYDLPLCYKGTHIRSPTLGESSRWKLEKMSMNGSAFMDIIHMGPEWLKNLKSNLPAVGTRLELRDFQFPARNKDMIDNDYTFSNFLRLLFHFDACVSLGLENFSTAYIPHNRIAADIHYEIPSREQWSDVSFSNVSAEFLTEFFQREMRWHSMDFYQCSIPPLPCPFSSGNITVSGLPTSDKSPFKDRSLYNLLSSWEHYEPEEVEDPPGLSLYVMACNEFDDDFIQWLCEDRGDGECEALGLNSLMVGNCPNFSGGAIRRLITLLEAPGQEQGQWPDDRARLTKLEVYGKGPLLTDEDREWFNTCCTHLQFSWAVDEVGSP